MNILAIDTSCDDTSVAVLRDTTILSNVISSQTQLHKEWGGVVPNLARHAHQKRIDGVIKKALQQSGIPLSSIEAVAVTRGPGLAIALEVGITKAKEVSTQLHVPLIAVNHMEGHLYAAFASTKEKPAPKIEFPLLALLVSGGHTELVLMRAHGDYMLLGGKLDDAVGEAFDKVARMLGLGYPGGALLAKMANDGNPHSYPFTVPLVGQKDLNFSYSGIKAAAMRLVKEKTHDGDMPLTKEEICDIAASFQETALTHLLQRTKRALEQHPVKTFVLGGGVSANIELRKKLRVLLKLFNIPFLSPRNKKLCMDNAAMIGVVGYYQYLRGEIVKNHDTLERNPILDFGKS
jgi:N6-L-threonylcarbamoyladenine synthase